MTTTPTLTGQDIAEAQGALGALLNSVLAASGVSGNEYIAFRVITARGPWPGLDALGDYLGSQPQLALGLAGAANLCADLVHKGLVVAGPPVALTEAGRQLFETLGESVRQQTASLYAGLDEADLATTRGVLLTLTERARQTAA